MKLEDRKRLMEKDKKSPFREFAEKANEIRKRPLSPKIIQEINDLSKEIEEDDAAKEKTQTKMLEEISNG